MLVGVPVLFSLEPRSRVEELYDFRGELGELVDVYNSGRVAVVLGLRRMGKSSLVRSFLNSYGIPHVMIDVRRIIINEGRVGVRGFFNELSRALSEFLERNEDFGGRLVRYLSRIRGVSVSLSPPSVSLSWGRANRVPLTELLNAINEVAEDLGRKVVLAIDEAQELRGIGLSIPTLVAYIYDNLGSVVTIITGSQVGLMYDVLGLYEPDSPLYGRVVKEIRLKRLSREQSIEFLRLGFSEAGVNVSNEELERAADLLDGIIGWLTYYGWYRVHGGLSLEEILDIASKQEVEELRKFLTKSRAEDRYKVILKTVAERPRKWSEIKRAVEAREGAEIDSHNFTKLLEHLVKLSILEKANDEYIIPDPVLRHGINKYL